MSVRVPEVKEKLVNFMHCPCCGEVIRLTIESQTKHNKKANQKIWGANSTIANARKFRQPCPECGSKTQHKRSCKHNPLRSKI